MPLVDAKCTNCGAPLKVDNSKEAAICEHCGSAFIVEKAINNYNITNQNTIHAQVVNVYGNYPKERTVDAEAQIDYWKKTLPEFSYDRLISPNLLISAIRDSKRKPHYSSNAIKEIIMDYYNNLNFKFDFSYSRSPIIILSDSYGSSLNNTFQKIWTDSGNDGYDGIYFYEWIFQSTDELSKADELLVKIQEKITNYYIHLLVNGMTDVCWEYRYGENASIWKVQTTSKYEFKGVEEKICNKHLIPYLYKGLNNAKKLNQILCGKKYFFSLGEYSIRESNISNTYDYPENYLALPNQTLINFSNIPNQSFIDSIKPINKELYINELNSYIQGFSTKQVIQILKHYLPKEKYCYKDEKGIWKYRYEYKKRNFGDSERWKNDYRIKSIENGISYEERSFNKKWKTTYEWRYRETYEIFDIREALNYFRNIANNRCQYCGGSFKGLFNKKCSKCGRPKDY